MNLITEWQNTYQFVSLCESNKNLKGALDEEHCHVYECCIHGAILAFGIE
jgi:hypothetical protein